MATQNGHVTLETGRPYGLERQVGKAFLSPLVKLRVGRGKPEVIQKHKNISSPFPSNHCWAILHTNPRRIQCHSDDEIFWVNAPTTWLWQYQNLIFFLKHHHRESLPPKTQNYLLSLRPLNRCAEIIYKEWPPDRDTTFILKLQRIFPVIVNFFNYCFLLKDKLYNKLWRIIIEKIIMARQ